MEENKGCSQYKWEEWLGLCDDTGKENQMK